jgi:hypothetical protein
MNIKKMLIEYYEIHKKDSMSFEEELKQSEEFKRGAEYGRSETLRKIIEIIKKEENK